MNKLKNESEMRCRTDRRKGNSEEKQTGKGLSLGLHHPVISNQLSSSQEEREKDRDSDTENIQNKIKKR